MNEHETARTASGFPVGHTPDAAGLDGRVAIVTGSAGGIGAAIARSLGRRGVRVAAVDSAAGPLTALVRELDGDGVTSRAYPCDVTAAAQVEAMVERVEQTLGPVEFLVNAAGVLRPAAVSATTDEAWTTTLSVNTTGVFLVSRAVAGHMARRRRGAVVTVASNAATTARVGMAAYAASKAAAAMFTKCLGLELAAANVRCNVVSPGSTDTPMLARLWADGTGVESTLHGAPDAFRVGIPLGKIATPEEIAAAVVFLLSSRAGHITMHDLVVDGGATLGV